MQRLVPGLVGLFAWTATVAFGATLLDVADAAGDGSTSTSSEAVDLLLAITAVTILTGIAAIAATRDRPRTRAFLAASLAVLVIGLLTPAFLSGIVDDVARSTDVRVGPWIRLGEGALVSVLAFVGLWTSWRNPDRPPLD